MNIIIKALLKYPYERLTSISRNYKFLHRRINIDAYITVQQVFKGLVFAIEIHLCKHKLQNNNKSKVK